jgi:ribosome-binding factor A
MAKHSRGPRDEDAPFTLDTGETPGIRAQRLEQLLFEELYRLFRMEVSDPRLAELVPTSIQMSPDLRNAKVMYALRDDPRHKAKPGQPQPAVRANADPRTRAVQQALLRVTPFLRTRLADGVQMKRLPDLHFTRDRLAEASLRAQDLMQRERLAAAKLALKNAPPPVAEEAEEDEGADAEADADGDADGAEAQPAHPAEAQRPSP